MYDRQRQTTFQQKNSNNIGGYFKQLAVDILSGVKDAFRVREPASYEVGRSHKPDYMLVALVIGLALLGLVLAFSISPALSAEYSVMRQGVFLVGGVGVFFIASRIPPKVFAKFSTFAFVASLLLCLVPVFMGMANPDLCTNGACRWIPVGPMSIQPAEFLKLGMMLFTASFLAEAVRRGSLNDSRKTLFPLAIITLIALFVVVVLQKDLGTGMSLAFIILIQMVISGMRAKQVVLSLMAVAVIGVGAIAVAPHRMERMGTFLSGDQCIDATGESYHICQVLQSLGSGGPFGKGIGQAVGAFGWVPENTSDSIFAILGESLGYIGVVAVLGIFALLLYRIIRVVDYTKSPYLRVIVGGAFGWIAGHLFINISSMTGLMPLTGITLPFLSFGGTSVVIIMFMIGVVFGISRYTSHVKVNDTNEEKDSEDSLRRRGLGRTRYTDRRGN